MIRRSFLRTVVAGLMLAWAPIAWAALPATAVWEVRTTGTATAGGSFDPSVTSPGVDYSQQAAPQVSYTDLVIGATNTQLTSAANPFTSTHVGNTIQIASGTGFTVGWYSVRSVASGVATMDRAVGTASSTGGVGKLGGAANHPATIGGVLVAGNTLWIAGGTYDCGATSNASGGRLTVSTAGTATAPNRVYGYTSTRGDGAPTRPILRASAASVTILTASGSNTIVEGLEFQGNGQTTAKGLLFSGSNCQAHRLKFTSLTAAPACDVTGTACLVADCEAASCTNMVYQASSGNGILFLRCSARNSGSNSFSLSFTQGSGCVACVSTVAAAAGFISSTNAAGAYFLDCVARGGTGGSPGFQVSNGGMLDGCIASGNAGYGFSSSVAAAASTRLYRCAGYGNTAGNLDGNQTTTGFIILTSDPFNNASTLDFSLNSVAGGGALLRSIPRTLPGLSGTSYPDVGAYQSQATASGTPDVAF